jgi:hypothetical protein
MQISILREWLNDFLSRISLFYPLEKDVIYFNDMLKFFIKNTDNQFRLGSILSEFQNKRLFMALELKDKVTEYISSSSDETLDAAFTYFCNANDMEYAILLLKKLKDKNHSKYYEYIDKFIYTADFNNSLAINSFLFTIGYDYTYIIDRLMTKGLFHSLHHYTNHLIPVLSSFDVSQLCQRIANTKMYNFGISDNEYFCLICKIFILSPSFNYYNFNYLLKDYLARSNFSYYLSNNYYDKMNLLESFGKYLHVHYSYEYYNFENILLDKMDPRNLTVYSSKSYFCSKRKFLEKVSSFKDQDVLIDFIKVHPEFQKLLPLM